MLGFTLDGDGVDHVTVVHPRCEAIGLPDFTLWTVAVGHSYSPRREARLITPVLWPIIDSNSA